MKTKHMSTLEYIQEVKRAIESYERQGCTECEMLLDIQDLTAFKLMSTLKFKFADEN